MQDFNVSRWPTYWPDPTELFAHGAESIASIDAHPVMGGYQAIIRFANGYGVKIHRYSLCKIFEMRFLKFFGPSINEYELADDTPIAYLTLAFTNEDIFAFCEQVSLFEPANA